MAAEPMGHAVAVLLNKRTALIIPLPKWWPDLAEIAPNFANLGPNSIGTAPQRRGPALMGGPGHAASADPEKRGDPKVVGQLLFPSPCA